MFLLVEDKVDIACQVVIRSDTCVVTHISELGYRLPDMLDTKGQGALQLVGNLIRHTLTSNPHREGKGELRHLSPLYGQVVGIFETTFIAKDLVADKQVRKSSVVGKLKYS